MSEKIECQKIKNLRGCLCISLDGGYFFRTYHNDGSFCDYDINHSDMEIEIVDSDAYIYKKDGECFIDHAPETLGMRNSVIEVEGVSQNGYAEYLPTTNEWLGPLDHIESSTMYMLKMKHAATLELKGTSVISDNSPLMLLENSQSVWITVQAIAGANPISSVFAQIIPPQAFIQNNQETILYPIISLTYHQELNQYKGLLNDLYKPGIYKIVIFAQDTQKILSNAVIYSVNAPGIYRPGDLNYDRQTNVDDVIMALKIVSNIQSEIKIDQKIGLVEVIDLLKKAGTF